MLTYADVCGQKRRKKKLVVVEEEEEEEDEEDFSGLMNRLVLLPPIP